MTTDITELAQREKFEAWWERTQHNGNPPRFGWERWRDGEGYKVDDDESELDGMWEAWKAAGDELVEALEKAQAQSSKWLEAYHKAVSIGARYEERIAELESRTVKLPVGYTASSGHPFNEAERTVMIPGGGDWLNRFDVEHVMTAAGIKWEAE